jgi:hypothetical protein
MNVQVNDGAWHHIAAVTDVVKAVVFVDGDPGKQSFVVRESGSEIGKWSVATEITFGGLQLDSNTFSESVLVC